MFGVATELSGLDKSTLPVELLPLNSIQLARGLLNFTVIQTLDRWVLPFWAEQQYDPLSPSFVPRSHLGLSMNITNRNWTSVGNPWCAIEPIVDPRGMVTLHPNGWSIDTWLRVGDTVIFPSRDDELQQSLHEGLPIVHSSLTAGSMVLHLETYTDRSRAIHRVSVRNMGIGVAVGSVGLAVRPFNPEGVALIDSLVVRRMGHELIVNGKDTLHFESRPSRTLLSNRSEGDAAWMFSGTKDGRIGESITCPAGLANGVAEFFLALNAGETWTCTAWTDLESHQEPGIASSVEVKQQWETLLADTVQFKLPDRHIADLVAASHSSLLTSIDGNRVKPGPATYHYFWFRDAAYMLLALDRLGHGSLTRNVITGYPEMQESSGMFRSQQGEWDSSGQAIWSIWQHGMLMQDRQILNELYEPMRRAARWIDKSRQVKSANQRSVGLMPRGLSAEHLGLADVYFWDSLWSLAGLEAFVRVCQLLGRSDEEARTRALALALRADLEESIAATLSAHHIDVIPAGPYRDADAGMIGSIVAWYPLQQLPPDDLRMQATVNRLLSDWFIQGMFYQPIVHSGLNAYLTLQIAQALLYAGRREDFWKILMAVSHRATPTYTYPEAIHPGTGAGAMGDGHHAWASAEVVLALRNAFILERWPMFSESHSIDLLSGIPEETFFGGKEFGIRNAPVPDGTIDIAVLPQDGRTSISIHCRRVSERPTGAWYLSLPHGYNAVHLDDGTVLRLDPSRIPHRVLIPSRTQEITCTRSTD
jgi:hypothetical protein